MIPKRKEIRLSPMNAQCLEILGFSTRNPKIESGHFSELRRQTSEFAEAKMARICGERREVR